MEQRVMTQRALDVLVPAGGPSSGCGWCLKIVYAPRDPSRKIVLRLRITSRTLHNLLRIGR
jgi:hypothetical protein